MKGLVPAHLMDGSRGYTVHVELLTNQIYGGLLKNAISGILIDAGIK